VIESKCAVLHYINAVGCTISPFAALEWSAHAKAALMVSDGARVIQLHMRFDGYIEFHVMLWLVSGSSFALLGFSRRLIRLQNTLRGTAFNALHTTTHDLSSCVQATMSMFCTRDCCALSSALTSTVIQA
jgi:hypothetical protein